MNLWKWLTGRSTTILGSATLWTNLIAAAIVIATQLAGVLPPQYAPYVTLAIGVMNAALVVLKKLNPPAPGPVDPNVPTPTPGPIDIPGLPPWVSKIINAAMEWLKDGPVDIAKGIAPPVETRAQMHKIVDDLCDRSEQFAKAQEAKSIPLATTGMVTELTPEQRAIIEARLARGA